MPTALTVLPHYGLMYVRYSGHATAAEAIEAFQEYLDHPDYAPGQKHLIDFTEVTGFEGDYTKLMELQARLVDTVMDGQQALFVYCAPTPLTQQMSQHSVTAWKDIKKVVVRVLTTEAEAMDVVGLPGRAFAELRQPVT